jgi:hypothetical protein
LHLLLCCSPGGGGPGSSRLGGRLDRAKDIADLALQRGELKIDDAPPRVQNHIHRRTKRVQILPDSLAHAPLNAVAIDRLAHHLSNRQPNARPRRIRITQGSAIRAQLRSQREEVRHLFGKLFPAGLVHPLIIGVLAKTEDASAGGHAGGSGVPDSISVASESRMTQS